MRFSDLNGKKVALFGLGREGYSFINLWLARKPKASLTILDETTSQSDQKANQELASSHNFEYITGNNVSPALSSFDVVIKSPGISKYRSDIINAKEKGTKFSSLVDLWFSENNNPNIIAITGTKGKSTTSSLTVHLLNALGKKTTLAGNIGIPLFSDLSQDLNSTAWVVELSSYQATEISTSIPYAMLLNLYPEHTNWHGSVTQYYQDKLNIFRQQNNDAKCIINGSDPNTALYKDDFKNPTLFNTKTSIHVADDYFYDGEKKLFSISISPLLGQHNAHNICAALTVISLLGFDVLDTAEALKSFTGLHHRLEFIGEKNEIKFIDDSISTIPQAALAALNAFKGSPTTLLLGGQKRAQEWDAFANAIQNDPPYAIITMPSNGNEIAKTLRDFHLKNTIIYEAKDLQDGVKKAKEITPKGGTVLLSPAAPSYDHFKNFEERGECFKQFALE